MKIIRDAQIVLYMYFYLKHSSSVFFFLILIFHCLISRPKAGSGKKIN